MAKTNWTLDEIVMPSDMNSIGVEINNKRNSEDYETGTNGGLKDISGTSVKSISKSGRYKGLNCPNAPTQGAWYYYDVEFHGSGWAKITARKFNNAEEYTITCSDSVWSSWVKRYNAEQKPTPAEIGALPAVGGTVPETVKISSTSAEKLILERIGSDANVAMKFVTPKYGKYLGIANDILKFGDTADLGGTGYSIYHEGNKPTMEEINKENIITTGMDLNNIKTPGFYKCDISGVAATLKNCPTELTFNLLVHGAGTQIITEGVAAGGARTWSRSFRNGSWGFWDKNFSEFCPPKTTDIITDPTRRFISDDEKITFNSKAPGGLGIGGTAKRLGTGTRLDSLTVGGLYTVDSSPDKPVWCEHSWVYCLHIDHSPQGAWASQLVWSFDDPSKMYIRTKMDKGTTTGAIWQEWKSVGDISSRFFGFDYGSSKAITSGSILGESIPIGFYSANSSKVTDLPRDGWWNVIITTYNSGTNVNFQSNRNRCLIAISAAEMAPSIYMNMMFADGSFWTGWQKLWGPPESKAITLASGVATISGRLNKYIVEGNRVIVDVNVSGTIANTAALAMGLPKPLDGNPVYGIVGADTAGVPYPVYLDASGNIRNNSNASKPGCCVHFTYIKDPYA